MKKLYIEFYNKGGFVLAVPAKGGSRINLGDTAEGLQYNPYDKDIDFSVMDVRLAYRDVEPEEN